MQIPRNQNLCFPGIAEMQRVQVLLMNCKVCNSSMGSLCVCVFILTDKAYSQPELERPLFAVNGGEGRDPWLYRILRI